MHLPVRGAQALDPAALLIDQDGEIVTAAQLPQVVRERPQLRRGFYVAVEQDVSGWIGAREQAALGIG